MRSMKTFLLAFISSIISGYVSYYIIRGCLNVALVSLASRLTYATIFGPIFAWYLLARGVKGLVAMAEPSSTVLIEYQRQ